MMFFLIVASAIALVFAYASYRFFKSQSVAEYDHFKGVCEWILCLQAIPVFVTNDLSLAFSLQIASLVCMIGIPMLMSRFHKRQNLLYRGRSSFNQRLELLLGILFVVLHIIIDGSFVTKKLPMVSEMKIILVIVTVLVFLALAGMIIANMILASRGRQFFKHVTLRSQIIFLSLMTVLTPFIFVAYAKLHEVGHFGSQKSVIVVCLVLALITERMTYFTTVRGNCQAEPQFPADKDTVFK